MVLAERKITPNYQWPAKQRQEGEPTELQPVRRSPARVVRVRRRLRVGRFLFTVACVFALAFVVIAGQTRVAALGYEVSTLENRLDRVQADNEYLRVKIGQLATPARLEGTARDGGMTYEAFLRFVDGDPAQTLAEARTTPAPTTQVVSLVSPDSRSAVRVELAATSSPASLDVVSQWFFHWLTGVRAAEASGTK